MKPMYTNGLITRSPGTGLSGKGRCANGLSYSSQMLLGLEMDRPPHPPCLRKEHSFHEGRVEVEGETAEQRGGILGQPWLGSQDAGSGLHLIKVPSQWGRQTGQAGSPGGGGHWLAIGVAKDKLLRLYNFPESLQIMG